MRRERWLGGSGLYSVFSFIFSYSSILWCSICSPLRFTCGLLDFLIAFSFSRCNQDSRYFRCISAPRSPTPPWDSLCRMKGASGGGVVEWRLKEDEWVNAAAGETFAGGSPSPAPSCKGSAGGDQKARETYTPLSLLCSRASRESYRTKNQHASELYLSLSSLFRAGKSEEAGSFVPIRCTG